MKQRKARERLLSELLSESREELVHADNKVAILLAAVGIVVGAIAASVLSGEWTPFDLPLWLGVIWWVSSLAFLFSVFALGSAIYPRVSRVQVKTGFVGYFGDVLLLAKSGELENAIEATLNNEEARQYDQLIQISGIVSRKYRLLRLSLTALGFGTLLFVVVAIGWGIHLILTP